MKKNSNDLSASLAFDMADFEKRLEETQQETSRVLRQSVMPKNIPEVEQTATTSRPAVTHAASPTEQEQAPAESVLLARLAHEAKENLDSKQSDNRHKQAKARRVHDALDRLFKFLTPFIQYVNNIEHAINRTYRLDARTIFADLQWREATVDYRKLSLAEEAHFTYVVLNVKLTAPEPVLLKRPWDQFEALKKEMHHLRLNVLDDLEELYKKPKQEWLEARLDPTLQVQIIFKGNYENGTIDVMTRNMENLGPAVFKLEPEDITVVLMDELGLYLIGRADKPPRLLQCI